MTTASSRLRLRVVPGAGSTEIVGRNGEAWKVRVAAPPERGKANEAVVRLLARALKLPERSVTFVSGHGGRDKMIELAGIDPAEIASRLASAERKEPTG